MDQIEDDQLTEVRSAGLSRHNRPPVHTTSWRDIRLPGARIQVCRRLFVCYICVEQKDLEGSGIPMGRTAD